jgi:hypothetical protein
MTTKADRIRWLAEHSAERRALREQGASAGYAIWTQIGGPQTLRYSAPLPVAARTKRPGGLARQRILAGLVQVQEGRCYICIAAGVDAGLARFGEGSLRPVLEHVHPISRGGKNRMNVAGAHAKCDEAKADRLPTPAELEALAMINAGLAPTAHPSRCQGSPTAPPSAAAGAGGS